MGPGSPATALRSLGRRQAVVVTVHGALVEPVVIDRNVGPLEDVSVPGAADAAVLGDLDELLRPPTPGEYLGGTFALSADGGLEPVTVWRAVTSNIAATGRGGANVLGWIVLAFVAVLLWWFFLVLLAWGLLTVALNRRRLLVSPARIAWQAGKDSFVVEAPYKVRAKVRFSRGSQSRQRKTKASLVVVDERRGEHVVPFQTPEALLRFTRALAVTHGIPWRPDIKIRGEKLAADKLHALLPLPSSSSSPPSSS